MTFTPDDLQSYLPFFIDAEYPKKEEGDEDKGMRGEAIVACALFILWLKNNVTEKKNYEKGNTTRELASELESELQRLKEKT